MMIVGLLLLAAAILGIRLSGPSDGRTRFAGNELIEGVVAFTLTASLAIGLVLTFVGIGRL